MGPMGRNGHGRFAPNMLAEVVYRSSHSPLIRSHRSARVFGLSFSSADAKASTSRFRSSVARSPRSHPSMAESSSALAASRFAAEPPPPPKGFAKPSRNPGSAFGVAAGAPARADARPPRSGPPIGGPRRGARREEDAADACAAAADAARETKHDIATRALLRARGNATVSGVTGEASREKARHVASRKSLNQNVFTCAGSA